MNKAAVRWIRTVVMATLIATGAAACTWQGVKPEASGPRQLFISGQSSHMSDAQIARLAAPYLQSSFFNVDLAGLKKALLAQPWLTDVTVSRHAPNGILVHVADHKPVADWGAHEVLASDGALFTPDKRPRGLVQLDGPSGQAAKVYAQYRQLSGILAGHGVHLASLELTSDGDWQGRMADGLELRLGQKNLAARMTRFVRFGLDRPAAQQALAQAGYVDLRYSDGFAVGGKRNQVASVTGQENMG